MTRTTEARPIRELSEAQLSEAGGGIIVHDRGAMRGIIVQRGDEAAIWVQRGIIVQ